MKQFMSVLAFAYKAEDRKYPTPFKKELWIPPLITTRVQSRYSGSLPVLYTNDPGVAEKWAKQHFLGSGNVAIGWDMEV